MPSDSITPELLELPPDSMEVVPDSLPPDSMEVLPNSLPPGACVCGRCGLVHEDRRASDHAHSRYYRPCPSCGLIHADYFVDAVFGRIKVNCVIFREQYKSLLPDDAKASVRSQTVTRMPLLLTIASI
jgi:hypothetical protein